MVVWQSKRGSRELHGPGGIEDILPAFVSAVVRCNVGGVAARQEGSATGVPA